MLVNLTPDRTEIKRRRHIAKENKFEYMEQSNVRWKHGTGIYQSNFPFNFSGEEFMEKLDGWKLFSYMDKPPYGVADNIQQIKDYYQDLIERKDKRFVIALTPVYQDREKRGKGGGWRWHKWGPYIGKLNPQYEYLDDEDFGEGFKYVICFHIYEVLGIKE